jgi:hypothetical protein
MMRDSRAVSTASLVTEVSPLISRVRLTWAKGRPGRPKPTALARERSSHDVEPARQP